MVETDSCPMARPLCCPLLHAYPRGPAERVSPATSRAPKLVAVFADRFDFARQTKLGALGVSSGGSQGASWGVPGSTQYDVVAKARSQCYATGGLVVSVASF